MIRFPNAKINIGLHVVNKREDGYHNIESIFYPIPLQDCLEIIKNDQTSGIELSVHGIELPNDGAENLCTKAYKLLSQNYNLPSVKAALLKQIPSGAGLGGGSSDAAEMLKMLNDFFNLGIKSEELEKLAAQLGSDCPFFIRNQPSYVSGRGEFLEPVNLDLSNKFFVLVNPGIHVPTPIAYSKVSPRIPEFDLRQIAGLPIEEWNKFIVNDFEPGIFKMHPGIEIIKRKLYEIGAVYASMSGSGSSVYALFDAPVNYDNCFPDYFTFSAVL